MSYIMTPLCCLTTTLEHNKITRVYSGKGPKRLNFYKLKKRTCNIRHVLVD